jgi:hypothetical protein
VSEDSKWYDVLARHVGTEADFAAAGLPAAIGVLIDSLFFAGGLSATWVAIFSGVAGLGAKKGLGAVFGPGRARRRRHRRLGARLSALSSELRARLPPPVSDPDTVDLVPWNPLRACQVRVETAARLWHQQGLADNELEKVLDAAERELLGPSETVTLAEEELPVIEFDPRRLE